MRILKQFARWAGVLISLFGVAGILGVLREIFGSQQGGKLFLGLFMLGMSIIFAVGGIMLERNMAKRLQKDKLDKAFSKLNSPNDKAIN